MRSLLLLTVVAGSLAVHGCSKEPAGDPLVEDLGDLCGALSAGAGVDEQEAAFFDRAHDAVHELAERVTESDPGLGAELLESKQVVEAGLSGAEEPVPAAGFERLLDAANAALAEIELEKVSCR